MISHNYSFDAVELDTSMAKRKLGRRSPQPIPLALSRGREDNLMYRVSEGYNLEEKDKTFFDKYNVLDMLSSKSRSGLNSTSVSRYGNLTGDQAAVRNILRQHRPPKDTESTERVSSHSDDDDDDRDDYRARKNYLSVLERKAPGISAFLNFDQKPMTLEERILQGTYKK